MGTNDQPKPRLSVVAFGPLDSGKSTTLGHLMYLMGAVSQREMEKIEQECIGMDSFKYAWLFDKHRDARERGITIDVSIASQTLSTSRCAFAVIDTPGHLDYNKNTISGIALGDCGLLVVPAVWVSQSEEMAIVRDQLVAAFTFGIRQVIVAINKMDIVEYSQESFDQAKTEVTAFMKSTGFVPENVYFIPVTGWVGDNLIQRSTRMTWYDGPTLVDALDHVVPPRRAAEKPLRVSLLEAYKISGVGTVAVGRVETGTLKPGMTIAFSPNGSMSTVQSIEMSHQVVAEARPGDSIGFCLTGISAKELKRGYVASDALRDPARQAIEFTAQVVFTHLDALLSVGSSLVVHCHATRVTCRVKSIFARLDRQTGAVVDGNPKRIENGDSCIVVLVPTEPMTIEAFREYPSLGRILLREENRVTGFGIVKSVKKARKVTEFKSLLAFSRLSAPLTVGSDINVRCRSVQAVCQVKSIVAKVDGPTETVADAQPEFIDTTASFIVVLEPKQPIFLETYQEHHLFGTIFVGGSTDVNSGFGCVKSVKT